MEKFKKSIILVVVIIIVVIALGIVIYFWSAKPANHQKTIDIDSITLENLTDQADLDLFEEVKTALKADPNDGGALMDLARLQKYNGSYEDGVYTLELVRETEPENITVLNNLGEMYILARNFDSAEKTYLDLLAIDSQWINAYIWLDIIYQEQMPEVFKTDKYPDLLKKGMAEDIGTNKTKFLHLLGNYYRDIGNKDEALNWYNQYLEINPTDQAILKEVEKLNQ